MNDVMKPYLETVPFQYSEHYEQLTKEEYKNLHYTEVAAFQLYLIFRELHEKTVGTITEGRTVLSTLERMKGE